MNLEQYIPIKKPLKKDFEYYIVNAISIDIKESLSVKVVKKADSLFVGLKKIIEDVIVVLNKEECENITLFNEDKKEISKSEECVGNLFYGHQISYSLESNNEKLNLPEDIMFQNSLCFDYKNFKQKESLWALDYKRKYDKFKKDLEMIGIRSHRTHNIFML